MVIGAFLSAASADRRGCSAGPAGGGALESQPSKPALPVCFRLQVSAVKTGVFFSKFAKLPEHVLAAESCCVDSGRMKSGGGTLFLTLHCRSARN